MSTKLNLARSWRSKRFEHIIGQPLPVRILKNSLYTNHFFPVYLFAGERGCGKTTTARVFAAALNCEQLPAFQRNAQLALPCLDCSSCRAMAQEAHPDFIEIDAASHTGVDNVRTIIEAATFMPVLGVKRIYLIDEAHMLSKAAFNAFLKLLEEPPPSVIFMLATTDPHKIIDTVRSRCFQLFFTPVAAGSLQAHLQQICETEKIAYSDDGLSCIVEASQGFVRDAINLLEQVRFATEQVTKKNVQEVLGHLDDERLVLLFKHVVVGDVAVLLSYIKEISLPGANASYAWEKLYHMVRSALWLSYGVDDETALSSMLKLHAVPISQNHVLRMLQLLCEHEQLFYKISKKYPLLEVVLITLCRMNQTSFSAQSPAGSVNEHKALVSEAQGSTQFVGPKDGVLPEEHTVREETIASPVSLKTSADAHRGADNWTLFLQTIESGNDQLLSSIFKQAVFVTQDEAGVVHIQLPKRLTFFEDTLHEQKTTWTSVVQQLFGPHASLLWQFVEIAPSVSQPSVLSPSVSSPSALQPFGTQSSNTPPSMASFQHREKQTVSGRERGISPTSRSVASSITTSVDISDSQKWKMTHTLLKQFPGTVSEIGEEFV